MAGRFRMMIMLMALFWTVLPLSDAGAAKTIMYIPHDNRPISYQQTADSVKAEGFDVLTPPEELLGSRENPKGQPEKLAKWAKENAKKADAAVISSDALVYGSLVASRKHDLSYDEALKRLIELKKIHKANKNMKIYVFSSIMRTPRTAADSGGLDDEDFIRYVEDISNYTALLDKREQAEFYKVPGVKLTRSDKEQIESYEKTIPKDVLERWLARRYVNRSINISLLEMLKMDGDIAYLALGCDDNARYSQTDRERRWLDMGAATLQLDETEYQSIPGLDELGYLLLTRALNDLLGQKPFVSVHYADGVGGDTVPAASNEPIADTVAAQIKMAGGMTVKKDISSDYVFLVNTGFYGTTDAANAPSNGYEPDEHIVSFADTVQKFIKQGKRVSVADITFGNGADNSLMQCLYDRRLLGELSGYAGWNTPTNSTGYAVAMGMNSLYSDKKGVLDMLSLRYIDDWLYQSNVRQSTADEIDLLHGVGDYLNTGTKTMALEVSATKKLRRLIRQYGLAELKGQAYLRDVEVLFPWHRMYEAKFIFPGKK